jgi:GT2 family glycosyltransferase
MPKPVAIILLNWNTPVHTANCINSLLTYCNKELFDILVTDNGSTDGSLSLLKAQFPDLVYIENKENLGFAEGNNRGLVYNMEKGYSYSLIMNTDTLVDEDIITKLTAHLDEYMAAAAVQPAIYWMHNKTQIWNGRGLFNPVLGLTYFDKPPAAPDDPDTYKKAKWLTGCCMLVRNSALTKTGLFDKRFFLYYEDSDLSFRLRGRGYELHYLPSCKMYHEAGVSATIEKKEGSLSPVIHYYMSRNHIWFLRKYGNPLFYPVNIVYNGFYYLSVWIYFKFRRRNEKARSLIKGLKEGLFTPKNSI